MTFETFEILNGLWLFTIDFLDEHLFRQRIYADMISPWDAIKADTYRQYGRFNWNCLIIGVIKIRPFRAIVTMRICQLVANSCWIVRLTLPFFRVLHRIVTSRVAVELPWQTQIGGGLAVNHGWGLVVNRWAKIGNNVTLFHGVTIGQRDRISHEGNRLSEYPVLEDEVSVGPHAIIVGGVTIGRGSRIAGGAFITENVPPYSVVRGNPAEIVKRNCIPDVKNPALF